MKILTPLIADLYDLLRVVRTDAGENFSGVGVLVSNSAETLPLFPLRSKSFVSDANATAEVLSLISRDAHEYHDGFHVLTSSLDLVMTSLYFSPPIVLNLRIDANRRIGGRYMAAMFGSTLPGVLATGVASPTYGIAVFFEGKEVRFDDVR